MPFNLKYLEPTLVDINKFLDVAEEALRTNKSEKLSIAYYVDKARVLVDVLQQLEKEEDIFDTSKKPEIDKVSACLQRIASLILRMHLSGTKNPPKYHAELQRIGKSFVEEFTLSQSITIYGDRLVLLETTDGNKMYIPIACIEQLAVNEI